MRDFYTLSPCIWEENGNYHVLLRVVNRAPAAQKVSRIHYGSGVSGPHFALDEQPAIAPGPRKMIATVARIPRLPPKITRTMSTTRAGINKR